MKQIIEIEVPEGKKAVWEGDKIVFKDIIPPLPKTWVEFCLMNPIKKGKHILMITQMLTLVKHTLQD